MTTIYLSGPLAGVLSDALDEFDHAAEVLRGAGHVVLSPTELVRVTDDIRVRLDVCSRALVAADVVVMLRGWERSGACMIESLTATLLGKPVGTLDSFMSGALVELAA